MKIISTLLIIGFSLTFFSQEIIAQEDSVTIESSIELKKESDFKQKRKYKYLDNNYREEKTLIKLGTLPMYLFFDVSDLKTFWANSNITLSLEKKISPSFSIIFDNGFYHDLTSQYYYGEPYYFNNLGLRYYYSMNKRIKQNRSRNNFHANYFSFKLEELTKYGLTEKKDDSGLYNTVTLNDWVFEPYINLSWGMQRRIGRFGFVDVGPYFKFKRNSYEFGLNLQLGLGWGFKK